MPKNYDEQYKRYMAEAHQGAQDYKAGKMDKRDAKGNKIPYGREDIHAPKYSQRADDERQATRAGLGKHIQFGPPAPAWDQVEAPLFSTTIDRTPQGHGWVNILAHDPVTKEEMTYAPQMEPQHFKTEKEASQVAASRAQDEYDAMRRDPESQWYNPSTSSNDDKDLVSPGKLQQWLQNGKAAWENFARPYEHERPRFNTGHPSPEGAKGNDELRNQMFKGLTDDQNAWMGMGGGAGAVGMTRTLRGMKGAGKEALFRLFERGVTPEYLDKMLMRRGVDWDTRHEIRSGYRGGTELAMPEYGVGGRADVILPNGTRFYEDMARQKKLGAMKYAGDILKTHEQGQRGKVGLYTNPSQEIPNSPKSRAWEEKRFRVAQESGDAMESVTRGNAAAGALSRQVGRSLEEPKFGPTGPIGPENPAREPRALYGPYNVATDAEYYRDHPIKDTFSKLPEIDVARQADNTGERQAYMDRRTRYNFGRSGSREINY